ncbi:MAG TPA: IS1182 family transposase [Hyphomicrobiaceae bacterium]|nr:IS1182 family transposase [Hyphomicrobiaceae bacterium]
MAHVAGESRYQGLLFSAPLDELVASDNPVRVIDAFVDRLDLGTLGFSKVMAAATGRPPYAPGDLLKLYVYGYLNRVRSSRRLEREAQCNVEVMWLLNRLAPAFKTIADFRKDHAGAIVAVCRAFVRFCRELALYGGEVVAIDGSKIEAVASRKKVITAGEIARRTAAIDRQIAEYLASLDEADRREQPGLLGPGDVASALAALAGQRRPQDAPAAATHDPAVPEETDSGQAPAATETRAALEALQQQRAQLQELAQAMASQGSNQVVLGEEEARLMRTARHGHQVAYNAQSVVDARHKLIVAFELTNDGNDQGQLLAMARQGQEALQVTTLTAVADAGYSNGEQGRQCEAAGIVPIVPRPGTVNTADKNHFSRERFTYDAASDSWQCPAGETLPCRETSHTEARKRYWTMACGACALKPHCTDAARRTITRSFYEDDREAMHQRAMREPGWMDLRRETVEHPFGTMKWLMGYPRFLVRGLRKAKAELALLVLGFNLKRVINILGVPHLLQALRPAPA